MVFEQLDNKTQQQKKHNMEKLIVILIFIIGMIMLGAWDAKESVKNSKLPNFLKKLLSIIFLIIAGICYVAIRLIFKGEL